MSWPWKKKAASLSVKEKCNCLKPGHVQIPLESYTRFVTFDDQIKSSEGRTDLLEGEIESLKQKLWSANENLDANDGLVKQHAKVAEDAVNGWEKADAEVLSLKNQFEFLTLSKLKAEDHATELNAALKECMKETRSLKEQHERRLHDVVLSMKKEFDQMKQVLESRIGALDGNLVQATADNAALSKSLQERLNLIVKMNEDNALSESRIGGLNSQMESYEREIASLHYELRIAAKELEIRTEEKNMSDRSADVACKQHVEAAKKVAKLEAEGQRLRGLIRKRLPGPAAVAQMKTEVNSFERDCPRRLSFEGFGRETELYNRRTFAMGEEIRILKEALAYKNKEHQESQSKLQLLESHIKKAGPVQLKQLEFMDDFLEMEILHSSSRLIENDAVSQEFNAAVKKIQGFVLQMQRGEVNGSVEELFPYVAAENPNAVEFVVTLSKVLPKVDVASPDCVDKIALPGNHNWELNSDGGLEWKLEKEMMTSDLAKSSNVLEATRTQLHVAEHRLCDVECQLEAAIKSNGVSETQVKCMTESYRALEARAALLEAEVNEFRVKTEMWEIEVNKFSIKIEKLESELKMEREKYHEELQKTSQNAEVKAKQEKECWEMAEKLEQCQETILMLGEQLKAMQPQNELKMSTEKTSKSVASPEKISSDWEQLTPRMRSPMSRRHLGSPSSGFIKLFRGKSGH